MLTRVLFNPYDPSPTNLSVIAEEPLSVGPDVIGIVLMRQHIKTKSESSDGAITLPAGVERHYDLDN